MLPSVWDALVALIPPRSRRVALLSGDPEAIRSRFQQIQPQADFHILHPDDTDTDPQGPFDCVVIDHVPDGHPTRVREILGRLRTRIAPEGQVVIRFANAAHWTRLVGLLRGRLQAADDWCGTVEEMTSAIEAAGLEPFGIDADVQAADDIDSFTQLMAPALQAIGVEPGIFRDRASIASVILRARPPGPPTAPLLIQTLIGEPLACARPRIHEPHQCMRTIPGVHIASSEGTADLTVGENFARKIFIRQRHILSPADLKAQRSLIDAGYLVVAEFDDDPERFPEIAANNHLTFTACHAVQTSTDALAAQIRQWNPHVGVFPNQLLRLPDIRKPEGAPVVLFFGALNREDDWAPLVPGLNRIAARFGEAVRFQVVHDSAFFDAIESRSKAFEPFCSYDRYMELMAASHVALLPLAKTRFNEHKSDLKFLEASSVATVAVASPTVYGRSVLHGETGFLCDSPGAFESTLAALIRDPLLRERVGEAARVHVRDRRMLRMHYASRYEWYREILVRHDELSGDVFRRVPELATA